MGDFKFFATFSNNNGTSSINLSTTIITVLVIILAICLIKYFYEQGKHKALKRKEKLRYRKERFEATCDEINSWDKGVKQ